MTVAIFLGSLLIAMAIGIPIAVSLLVSGVALMWHLDFFNTQLLAQNLQAGFDSFPLLAVPFFILAGELMNVDGLSQRIIDMARASGISELIATSDMARSLAARRWLERLGFKPSEGPDGELWIWRAWAD